MSPRMIAIGLLFLFAGALLMFAVALQPVVPSPPTAAPTQTARVEIQVVTATPEPTPEAIGEVSADSVSVIAHRGERIDYVLSVRSTNAQGWGVYGYPCPELKGAHWEPSSGGLPPGTESFVWVEVDPTAQMGTCQGEIVITFLSKEDKIEKHIVELKFTILP